MSVLDDIGNAVNQAYDNVTKKAEDTISIAKLNQNIRQLRGSIEIQYIAIGKKYFNDHKDNAENNCSYTEEMDIIKESLKKIEQLEKDIERIRDISSEKYKNPEAGVTRTAEDTDFFA